MICIEYEGLHEIKSSLVVLKNVSGAVFDEIVFVKVPNELPRAGRVIQIDGDTAVVLVFEGTRGLTLDETKVKFTGRLLKMRLSLYMTNLRVEQDAALALSFALRRLLIGPGPGNTTYLRLRCL